MFHLSRLFKPFCLHIKLSRQFRQWILLSPEIWQKIFWSGKSFYSNILYLFLGFGILRVATLPRNTGIMRPKPEVKSSQSKNLDSSVKSAIAWSNLGLILKQQKRPCPKSLKGSKNRFIINNPHLTILSGKIKCLNVLQLFQPS